MRYLNLRYLLTLLTYGLKPVDDGYGAHCVVPHC